MQLGRPANAVLEHLVNHRWKAASCGFATHMDPRLRGDDEQTRNTPSLKVGVALLEAA